MLVPFTVGALEYKLFVGSMNKQITEKEIEEVGHLFTLVLLSEFGNFQRDSSRCMNFSFPLKLETNFYSSENIFRRYFFLDSMLLFSLPVLLPYGTRFY